MNYLIFSCTGFLFSRVFPLFCKPADKASLFIQNFVQNILIIYEFYKPEKSVLAFEPLLLYIVNLNFTFFYLCCWSDFKSAIWQFGNNITIELLAISFCIFLVNITVTKSTTEWGRTCHTWLYWSVFSEPIRFFEARWKRPCSVPVWLSTTDSWKKLKIIK